jgi:histidine triad (HIT) family protein
MSCVFCQIRDGELPADMLYQDDELMAFHDAYPQTSKHVLVVPKKHISCLNDVTDLDVPMMGRMINLAVDMAKKEGIDKSGYRLVINCGKEGGQVVQHLHLHVLGGRHLSSQMG